MIEIAPSTINPLTERPSAFDHEHFLDLLRQIESGGKKTHVVDPISSAAGPYQFVEETWFRKVAKFGATSGNQRLADAATAISFRNDDPIHVRGGATARKDILDLRFSPAAARAIARNVLEENIQLFQNAFPGQAITPASIYAMYYLGPRGGCELHRLLEAHKDNLDVKIADLIGEKDPAMAKWHAFHRKDGTSYTLAEMADLLEKKVSQPLAPRQTQVQAHASCPPQGPTRPSGKGHYPIIPPPKETHATTAAPKAKPIPTPPKRPTQMASYILH